MSVMGYLWLPACVCMYSVTAHCCHDKVIIHAGFGEFLGELNMLQ